MFKRSVYAVKNINKGERFTQDNIRIIRPGDGLPPKYYELMLTKTAQRDYIIGTPLTWESL